MKITSNDGQFRGVKQAGARMTAVEDGSIIGVDPTIRHLLTIYRGGCLVKTLCLSRTDCEKSPWLLYTASGPIRLQLRHQWWPLRPDERLAWKPSFYINRKEYADFCW